MKGFFELSKFSVDFSVKEVQFSIIIWERIIEMWERYQWLSIHGRFNLKSIVFWNYELIEKNLIGIAYAENVSWQSWKNWAQFWCIQSIDLNKIDGKYYQNDKIEYEIKDCSPYDQNYIYSLVCDSLVLRLHLHVFHIPTFYLFIQLKH